MARLSGSAPAPIDRAFALIDQQGYAFETPCNFFDLITAMKHAFGIIQPSVTCFVARAILQKMATQWATSLTPQTLEIAKGYAKHMAEDKTARDATELEIACLFLRPSVAEGMLCIHTQSGRFAEIVSADPDCINWSEACVGTLATHREVHRSDPFSLLPCMPLLRPFPLNAGAFPRISVDDLMFEYRAFNPYDFSKIAEA